MCQNPSYEVDHFYKEYKGRNGATGSLSKPDVFGLAAITRRRLIDQHCREGDITGLIDVRFAVVRFPLRRLRPVYVADHTDTLASDLSEGEIWLATSLRKISNAPKWKSLCSDCNGDLFFEARRNASRRKRVRELFSTQRVNGRDASRVVCRQPTRGKHDKSQQSRDRYESFGVLRRHFE